MIKKMLSKMDDCMEEIHKSIEVNDKASSLEYLATLEYWIKSLEREIAEDMYEK